MTRSQTTTKRTILMSQSTSDPTKPYEALIRRCWADPDFKARLLADPAAVIQEAGLPVPVGVSSVRAVENSPGQLTVVIPPNPDSLPPEQRELIAGGYFIFSRGGFSCDFVVHGLDP